MKALPLFHPCGSDDRASVNQYSYSLFHGSFTDNDSGKNLTILWRNFVRGIARLLLLLELQNSIHPIPPKVKR